jgi:hypothetical protein
MLKRRRRQAEAVFSPRKEASRPNNAIARCKCRRSQRVKIMLFKRIVTPVLPCQDTAEEVRQHVYAERARNNRRGEAQKKGRESSTEIQK